MLPTINLKAYLWALGVIQPANPEEVHNFLKYMSKSSNDIYEPSAIAEAIEYSSEHQLIELVSKKNNLFVLSLAGGEFLGKQLRLLRDKNRLLLLKSLRNASFNIEGSPEQEMDGASSSTTFRLTLKDAPRPEESLSSGPLPQSQRFFWPRVSEQLRIGSNLGDPSTPIKLNYYSRNRISTKVGISAIDTLAELIGVSPRLLSSMAKSADKQYRTFTMQKKSGGSREINSPRAFIKTVQYWISDYFLYRLKIHDNCFSYRKGLSIRDNARLHLNKKYVLCLDIESFFDNINREGVAQLIINEGVSENLSKVMSYLVTLNDKLPQGAPSSPVISNSYLYQFDCKMTEISKDSDVSYSRYADDLTFSGNDKVILEVIMSIAGDELANINLKLKESKTRIMNEHCSQIVTGVAVNNGELRPSRKFRSRVRVMFHQAQLNGDVQRLPTLRGYFNYLKSFDNGDSDGNLEKYESTISYLQELSNSEVS